MNGLFSRKKAPDVFHEASTSGRSVRIWLWVGGLAIVLLLLVIAGLTAMSQALSGTLEGRDSAVRAREHLKQFEFALAEEDLKEAQAGFEKADRALAVLSPMALLPGVGDSYHAGRALVRSGATSSRAFANTLSVGIEALQMIGEDEQLFSSPNKKGELLARWSGLDRETRQFILTRLKTRLPSLEVASNDLHLTVEDLEDAFRSSTSTFLVAQKEALVADLRRAQNYLEVFVQGTALLTSVSDEDGGNILLLFLNDNELRPGGGFIGSFGLLKLDAGSIASLTTFDVMTVDGPVTELRTTVPPVPLSEYLKVPAWFLRDANWSPDFAVSSETALRFFQEELLLAGENAPIDPAIRIDAVVGLTTSVAGDLLAVLGDIEVDGERFTSETIADTLENAIEFTFVNRGVTHERRKDIIQKIADVMRERLAQVSLDDWSEIFTMTAIRLQDKHLMFYSPNEDVQRLFVREHWAGTVAERFDGDYLLVVDANLAALKSDPAVRRFISYKIVLEGEHLVATTEVTYRHLQPFDPKTTRYRTFTRLYVPDGSELLSIEGSLANDRLNNPALLSDEPVVEHELGKTVFGAFLSVEPLTTRSLTFRYRLPDRLKEQVLRGGYDLMIQKQPGAQNHALTLDLNFGTKLKQADPSEDHDEWGDTTYRLNTILDQDRVFKVDF
ncbi:MAG: hypothetical protein UY81_C0001G0013 [Candidatus Giovannonibacteria bacterium GW2011_GWA2_53_7]|uniref:DUF4012 domain-containing protein n=1 Tax=Candidatus Giovannonibacteria bacterium GW2011_GWA2_53_7 TaxID=1618650 RepID=A0A0G2A8D9_9BACT|nr:MAG: hypothetical protein UY81_C0001G0013 [Candidatus Giovannonibacteria bacterium GW2011_GWA2_53_7]